MSTTVTIKPSPTAAGNGVFTTAPHLAAGSILFAASRPLVAVLDAARANDTCAWCLDYDSFPHVSPLKTTPDTETCKRCKKVRYCDRDCQQRDWEASHRYECKLMASQPQRFPTSVAAAIRILKGIARGEARYSALLALPSYVELWQQDAKAWARIEPLAHGAWQFAGARRCTREQAVGVLCLVLNNSHTLINSTLHPIGLAIDLMACSVNHSCEPNAVMVFDGPKVEIRALVRLEEDEEVFFSYVDETDPFGVRQTELRERQHFTCACGKCAVGLAAPQDALVLPVGGLATGAKEMARWVMTMRGQVPGIAKHFLGDGMENWQCAMLQFAGLALVEASDHDDGSKRALLEVATTLESIEASGAWPAARAPIPALYRVLLQMHLRRNDRCSAFRVALKTYFVHDPVNYPVPFHPRRVINAWSLAEVALSVSPPNLPESSPLIRELRQDGLDSSMLYYGLVRYVLENVPKSHGAESAFGVAVAKAWQDIMAGPPRIVDPEDPELATPELAAKRWRRFLSEGVEEQWPGFEKMARAYVPIDDIAAATRDEVEAFKRARVLEPMSAEEEEEIYRRCAESAGSSMQKVEDGMQYVKMSGCPFTFTRICSGRREGKAQQVALTSGSGMSSIEGLSE